MGGNYSSRHVSVDDDGKDGVTFLKGIRLSERVIDRMKEPPRVIQLKTSTQPSMKPPRTEQLVPDGHKKTITPQHPTFVSTLIPATPLVPLLPAKVENSTPIESSDYPPTGHEHAVLSDLPPPEPKCVSPDVLSEPLTVPDLEELTGAFVEPLTPSTESKGNAPPITDSSASPIEPVADPIKHVGSSKDIAETTSFTELSIKLPFEIPSIPNSNSDPVSNPVGVPISSPISDCDHVPDPMSEPVSISDPVLSPICAPLLAPISDPVPDPISEPVPISVIDTELNPISVPISDPVPISEPISLSVSISEPVPISDPASGSISEPIPIEVPFSDPRPLAESVLISIPVSDPTPAPTTEPTPISDSAPASISEPIPIPDSVSDPVPSSESIPISVPVSDSTTISEPVPFSESVPISDVTPAPITEPIPISVPVSEPVPISEPIPISVPITNHDPIPVVIYNPVAGPMSEAIAVPEIVAISDPIPPLINESPMSQSPFTSADEPLPKISPEVSSPGKPDIPSLPPAEELTESLPIEQIDVIQPQTHAVDEEMLRKEIAASLQNQLRKEMKMLQLNIQQQLDEEKANAKAQAQAEAKLQIEEEVQKVLKDLKATHQQNLADAIRKEQLSLQDDRLITQYYVMDGEKGSKAGRKGEISGKTGSFVSPTDRHDARKGKLLITFFILPLFHQFLLTYLVQTTEFAKVTAESYKKGLEDAHKRFKRFQIKPVCADLQSQILKCYFDNKGQTMSCSNIASLYRQCVDRARQDKQVKHRRLISEDLQEAGENKRLITS
ncbi:hypothetical protein DNTS_002166 [Danionella cerebrum]|uniref:CHCH domain-containing protein n=1 Tax=Danionella cerebrum TaxID=2873325 RepID=A0A553R1E7_9TELE|nr:hypothetical protein DNTS_002166 [Danionella translucida]